MWLLTIGALLLVHNRPSITITCFCVHKPTQIWHNTFYLGVSIRRSGGQISWHRSGIDWSRQSKENRNKFARQISRRRSITLLKQTLFKMEFFWQVDLNSGIWNKCCLTFKLKKQTKTKKHFSGADQKFRRLKLEISWRLELKVQISY